MGDGPCLGCKVPATVHMSCSIALTFDSNTDSIVDCSLHPQTLDRNVTVRATKGEDTTVLAEGIVRQRFYTSQEVDLLGRATGLQVVGQYGALQLPHMAPDDDDAFSLVIVLQKQ
jgi:hypothetical protein